MFRRCDFFIAQFDNGSRTASIIAPGTVIPGIANRSVVGRESPMLNPMGIAILMSNPGVIALKNTISSLVSILYIFDFCLSILRFCFGLVKVFFDTLAIFGREQAIMLVSFELCCFYSMFFNLILANA